MKKKTKFLRILIAIGIVSTIGLLAIPAQAQVEGGAIAAIDEPAEGLGGTGKESNKIYGDAAINKSKGKITRRAIIIKKPVAQNRTPNKWNGFVVGDKYTFLNFEVMSASKPYHTRAAKAGGASGLVQVEVLIDTNGTVLTARARTGNKLLHSEAERAALGSKFNRPAVYGKPARAIGFLVYRFGAAEDVE